MDEWTEEVEVENGVGIDAGRDHAAEASRERNDDTAEGPSSPHGGSKLPAPPAQQNRRRKIVLAAVLGVAVVCAVAVPLAVVGGRSASASPSSSSEPESEAQDAQAPGAGGGGRETTDAPSPSPPTTPTPTRGPASELAADPAAAAAPSEAPTPGGVDPTPDPTRFPAAPEPTPDPTTLVPTTPEPTETPPPTPNPTPDYVTWSDGSCPSPPASTPASPNAHLPPLENSPLSRIAFGSCWRFYRSRSSGPARSSEPLWEHMRNQFGAELWVWLGDAVYSRGHDMEAKRADYNAAREDGGYATAGPIGEPKIPVTGTWDDMDYGFGNGGNEYQCRAESQAEFVLHYNLPSTDPRHPDMGPKQQRGVYTSHMFALPGEDGGRTGNGIHLIMLDARSHRSPTFDTHGPCWGASSTILGDEQWTWLEGEMLDRTSEIKLIASGIQVLPPTSRGRSLDEYCAYDGEGGTFETANADVGEGAGWDAPVAEFEGWAEMPRERTRLLRLATRSMDGGRARRVIFLSGDTHSGEIMAKRVPPPSSGSGGGGSLVLYEVTASAVDQSYVVDSPNANRVRVRSADDRGDGVYHRECNFPFVYEGVTYDDCTDADSDDGQTPWCATETSSDNDEYVSGRWGNCLPASEELVPRDRVTYSGENICTDNYHHVCGARGNYGGMEVDWDRGRITLWVFTPYEEEKTASSIVIDL